MLAATGVIAGAAVARHVAKEQLAHSICKSLSSVLNVDPKEAELKLLFGSNILLKNVELVPQSIEKSVLTGTIQQIEFKWEWSGGSLIKESTLTIQGVRLEISLAKHEAVQSDENGTQQQDNDEEDTPPFIQQIIDTVNVHISDVMLKIHDPDESTNQTLVLISKTIELNSLGHAKDGSGLLQTFFIQSVGINLVEKETRVHLLLEPMDYQAKIKRFAGKRFQDDFQYGLEITGKNTQAPVQLYVSSSTFKALLRINDMLKSDQDDNANGDGEPEMKEEEQKVATVFQLPLPCAMIMLDNSVLTVRDSCWHICIDGTLPKVVLKEDILVDGHALLGLEPNVELSIDLSQNKIQLENPTETIAEGDQTASSPHVAYVQWLQREMTPAAHVIQAIGNVHQEHEASTKPTDSEASVSETTTSASTKADEKSWSLETINGSISVLIKGGDENADWIQASVDSPFLVMPENGSLLPPKCSSKGATIGPSSFGDFQLVLSGINWETESWLFQSMLVKIQEFLSQALAIESEEPSQEAVSTIM